MFGSALHIVMLKLLSELSSHPSEKKLLLMMAYKCIQRKELINMPGKGEKQGSREEVQLKVGH